MTLDDSGWILTKADFWRREVGECSLSGRAKVPDIKENIYSHQGGAIASKFDGLNDCDRRELLDCRLLIYFKVRLLVDCVWRQWCLPFVSSRRRIVTSKCG